MTSASIFGLLADILTWGLPHTKEESIRLAETPNRTVGYIKTFSVHIIRRHKLMKEKNKYDKIYKCMETAIQYLNYFRYI
jgi:uncharacterized protein YjcR